jgi:hypothetical protein
MLVLKLYKPVVLVPKLIVGAVALPAGVVITPVKVGLASGA